MQGEHIVKSFGEELARLNENLVKMISLAESQLVGAVEALNKGDEEQAKRIELNEAEVNALEQEINELSVRLLALREPKGQDLRKVLGIMRISVDIERCGDYAVNIARRTTELKDKTPPEVLEIIGRMAENARTMMVGLRDAFEKSDVAEAVRIWKTDDEVDRLYADVIVHGQPKTEAHAQSDGIETYAQILFVAKALERIGDHLTNVAEHIYYIVEASPLQDALKA